MGLAGDAGARTVGGVGCHGDVTLEKGVAVLCQCWRWSCDYSYIVYYRNISKQCICLNVTDTIHHTVLHMTSQDGNIQCIKFRIIHQSVHKESDEIV